MTDVNKNDWRDFLAHYGVKGMKWGKRKNRAERTNRGNYFGPGNNNATYARIDNNRKNTIYDNSGFTVSPRKISYKKDHDFLRRHGLFNASENRIRQQNSYSDNAYRRNSHYRRDLFKSIKKKRLKELPKRAISKAKNFLSRLFG